MAAEKIVFEVEIDGGQAENTLGGLEDRIEKLRELQKGEQIGSKAFNDLGRSIQSAESKIKDVELAFESLDMEQKLTASSDAVVGVAGGFEAAAGAMALWGSESEALEQTLSRVAGAMALTQGIRDMANGVIAMRKLSIATKAQAAWQQVLNVSGQLTGKIFGKVIPSANKVGSKSFKALRGAIIATGIGALVVAVGMLIANWDKLSAALGKSTAAQKASNAAGLKAIEAVSGELAASDKLSRTLTDETKTREQKVKAVKKLQEEYPNLLANVNAEKDSIEDVNKALKLNTKLTFLKAQADAAAELAAEEMKNELKAQTEAQTGANIGLGSHIAGMAGYIVESVGLGKVNRAISGSTLEFSSAQDVANIMTESTIKKSKENRKAYEDLGEQLGKQIEALEAEGAVAGKTAEKIVAAQKARSGARKKLREEMKKDANLRRIENKLLKDTAEIFDINKAAIQGNIDSIDKLQEALQRDINLRKEQQKIAGVMKEQELSHAQMMQMEFNQLALQDQENQKAEIQAAEDARQAKIDNAQLALNFMSSAADAFVKDEAKREKIRKTLAIAQIAIDTARGVSAAIAAGAGIPFPGNIPAILTGVTAVLAGIAQAKGILGAADSGINAESIASASAGAGGSPLNNISNTASLVNQDQQELGAPPVLVVESFNEVNGNVISVEESATF